MLCEPENEPADPTELALKYDAYAWSWARRMRHFLPAASGVDDLVQACRVALYRSAVRYDRSVHFLRYAKTAVVRAACLHVRYERRRGFTHLRDRAQWAEVSVTSYDGDLESVGAVEAIPDRKPPGRTFPAGWWEAVTATLDPVAREAVLLTYRDGLSLREVGASLRCSHEWARRTLARAVERLRECPPAALDDYQPPGVSP